MALLSPLAVAGGGGLDFTDTTATRIMPTVGEQSSNEKVVELGDFDRDGDLDVAVGSALGDFGGRRNKLYRNDAGVFNEISGGGVIPAFTSADVTRAVFFRDYDGDDWLDLYIVNDSNSDADVYLRNNHPGGVFTGFVDETASRVPAGGLLGASCSGVSADFNGDGFIDVYAGNYPFDSQDRMIFNDGSGVFTQVTNTNVPVDSDYTVDIASGDMNGDGRIDLLIGNEHDPLYIYYNNNQNAGSGDGDFSYPGSTQQIAPDNDGETVLEPVDLDGDGDLDIYWTNVTGNQDRILRHDGLDANNQAVFTTLTVLPASVTQRASRKAIIQDFDGDGRDDVLVMFESSPNSRPVILRNVSVDGDIRLLDWTPGDAFPEGDLHKGWHAATLDVNSDERSDIFLGGFNDDHFFDNVPSTTLNAATIGGNLPGFYNGDPLLISGELIEPGSGLAIPYTLEVLARGAATPPLAATASNNIAGGDQVSFSANDVPVGGQLSVIANSCGDIRLAVLDDQASELAASDRGAGGVEEALWLDAAPGGQLSIAIDLLAGGLCGDVILLDGFEN
ncbi:MAG: hypothetical protein Tsb002_22250 [Wenzhouxiangellaceae bacterium]